MKNCIVNCWPRATRPTDSPCATLTVFACYALKNPHCNATVGWPRNILHRKFPISTLCIYKKRPDGAWLFSGGVGIFYGPAHTKYRDYQGIFDILAPRFSPVALKFRYFRKILHKNNREFLY